MLDPTSQEGRRAVRDIARITHRNEAAYAGALTVALAVRATLVRDWPGVVPLRHILVEQLHDSVVRDALVELPTVEAPVAEVAAAVGTSGYVAESVPFAIFVAESLSNRTIHQVVDAVIQVGGDTDTIASIACQILGARHGLAWIPQEQLARMQEYDVLLRVARQFSRTCVTA